MALTYGFYNSVNHDRKYDAIQFGQIFDGLISDGVYAGYKKAMMVKANGQANQVIIQPGRAWFMHTWSYNDSDYVLPMPAPEAFLDRIDAVVLDVNSATSTRRNTFMVKTGTPSGNPQKPALDNLSDHRQYPLCYVRRHAGVQEIYPADVENAVGTEKCPFVVGIIDMVSIDDIVAKWEDEFFQWMEKESIAWENNIEHNAIAWNNWFNNLQYELDGDVAGHLQLQIDKIKKFASIYVVDKVLYVPMSGASVVGTKLKFAVA